MKFAVTDIAILLLALSFAALKLSGCIFRGLSVIGKSVSQPTRIHLMRIEPQYPTTLVIDGDKYPFDKEKMDRLIEEGIGHDETLIEVREIMSLVSPCRYFCPPWYRSFAVVSKVHIRKGELLCIYSGELEEKVQHRCSSYVYSMPAAEGVSHFDANYKGMPDLLVDASHAGNISRFSQCDSDL